MLAGRTERRDVPHTQGEWIEFKTLSGLQMQRARDEVTRRQTKDYLATIAGLDPETIATIRDQEERREKKGDARPDYDAEMLIKWGVDGWSLDIPCTDENKVLLDGVTFEWAFAQIVEMNTLPLAKSAISSPGENSHSSLEVPTFSSPTK